MDKPVLALTMGDAAGIGPELIVKVLSDGAVYERCRPFVVGAPQVMREAGRIVGASLQFREIDAPAEARFSPPVVDVLCPPEVRTEHVRWGALDPAMGRVAAVCLQTAAELALRKEVAGVVSAPLNKEAFHLAGYSYRDEVAFLADLTGSPEPFIVGVMDAVWTVAVTEHIPFRAIADLITKERVLRYIRHMHAVLQKGQVHAPPHSGDTAIGHLPTGEPAIAVAALNVHGGEGGLFGREEIEQIGPAIAEARAQGIAVQGPIPADTVFVRALAGEFKGVVCMYHDQANIARKLQARRTGASLFMGLPVVCGTTTHGTAFDKAGQGIADPGSLDAAVRYTALLSSRG